MALKRTALILALVSTVAFGLTSCTVQAPTALKVPAMPRRAGLPSVIVFMPLAKEMLKVHQGLRSELEEEFDVVTVPVDASLSVSAMKERLQREKPACVVIMNNNSLRLFRELQTQNPDLKTPPAVVLMTSFLTDEIKGLKRAVGIAYEVPGVLAFVRLRTLVDQPVKRIGVIHRARFKDYLARQSVLAAQEKFELVTAEVHPPVSDQAVRHAILRLINEEKVDAIWVLNDNALLGNQKLISRGWLRGLKRARLPVIVNVEALVSTEFKFGSFAVVPDHEALGVQAASKIFELKDDDWQFDDGKVDLPLSVETVLHLSEARRNFSLNEEALGQVNRLVRQ